MRAANTGISAVVDSYGRVWRSLPLNVEDVLDSALPRALPSTFFSDDPVTGPFLLLSAALLLAFVALLLRN